MVTIKEVKSYLNGARNINKQLKILEKALVNVVEDDINIVPAYGKDYVDSGRVSKPTEEEAIKLDDIRARILSKKIDYSNILFDRIELLDASLDIASLDNRILKERYINSLSWNNISRDTLYSVKYLMRIHSRAIKKITKYVNNSLYWQERIMVQET